MTVMRLGGWAWMAVLTLAGCGSEPSVEQPRAAPFTAGGAEAQGEPEPVAISGPPVRILAFGDSLFAGYGLGEGEGYPARLEAALRDRGIDARVSDAGVSGDTTAAGAQRIAFVLDNEAEAPDLAIIELGGNDLLRGIPPEQTRSNLAVILAELEERGIPAMLFGMRAPPNLGPGFVTAYDAIYPELAEQYEAALVPFFLESVWNRPELMQRDRIHPTARGIEAMVAATVDEVAEALPEED